MDNFKLINDDMLDMLNFIGEESIDAVLTDPPYELNFMGKGWDNAGISFQKETWQKCLRVLKPGGYLLAFGGSRTFHRIACAIEDAGFEIRDTIMWLYGSGFPKSHNIGLDIDKLNGCPDRGHRVATASRYHPDGTFEPNGEKLEPYVTKTEDAHKWNGWGTALKPSFEPIIVARKPIEGTVAKNCLKYGVGGINIDECRVETTDILKEQNNGKNSLFGGIREDDSNGGKYIPSEQGRFPANTILTYDETDFDEVCGGFPNTKSGKNGIRQSDGFNKNDYGKGIGIKAGMNNGEYGDSGSASRYFYCAKASKKDREEGLENFIEQKVNDGREKPIDNAFQRGETQRKNTHPTVKPTELMQYLVRLVTPKGGKILDPFMGSGSTGKAVMFENKERNAEYKFIGIEKEKEYYEIANARIKWAEEYKEETLDSMQININELLKE